jgi:hypothetical protein
MLVLLFVLQRENRRSIDNTKHYLQVHGGQCSLAPLQLAREGLRLTQFLVEPACTPSRACDTFRDEQL